MDSEWVGGRRYCSCTRDRKADGLLKKEGRSFVAETARCESVRLREHRCAASNQMWGDLVVCTRRREAGPRARALLVAGLLCSTAGVAAEVWVGWKTRDDSRLEDSLCIAAVVRLAWVLTEEMTDGPQV